MKYLVRIEINALLESDERLSREEIIDRLADMVVEDGVKEYINEDTLVKVEEYDGHDDRRNEMPWDYGKHFD